MFCYYAIIALLEPCVVLSFVHHPTSIPLNSSNTIFPGSYCFRFSCLYIVGRHVFSISCRVPLSVGERSGPFLKRSFPAVVPFGEAVKYMAITMQVTI